MTKEELFVLYGKVQNKDKVAEQQLIQEHKKHFPNNHYHKFPQLLDPAKNNNYRQDLHIMYLNLTK